MKVVKATPGQRGSQLVEFAFVSTLFMVVLFAVFEFGFVLWRYNMVAQAAQQSARWASVRGHTAILARRATAADITSFITGMGQGVPMTVTAGNPSVLDPGAILTVVVSSTYSPMTAFVPSAALTVRSTAQIVMVR